MHHLEVLFLLLFLFDFFLQLFDKLGFCLGFSRVEDHLSQSALQRHNLLVREVLQLLVDLGTGRDQLDAMLVDF